MCDDDKRTNPVCQGVLGQRTGDTRRWLLHAGTDFHNGEYRLYAPKDYDTNYVMEKLITAYRFELVEDHHSPGSGRYGVLITLPEDIGAVLPYLNSMLDDTWYDQANQVLIGSSNGCRYAFRPHEIQIGVIADASTASRSAGEVVDLVNRVWLERDRVVPSSRERKLPTIYALFRLLPRTLCEKQCGYPSCLAFAADLRTGAAALEQCPLLSTSPYADNRKQIIAIFSVD